MIIFFLFFVRDFVGIATSGKDLLLEERAFLV